MAIRPCGCAYDGLLTTRLVVVRIFSQCFVIVEEGCLLKGPLACKHPQTLVSHAAVQVCGGFWYADERDDA